MDPESLDFNPPALDDGSRIDLPVLVMAGNRPHYLFRMLKSLRGVQGLNPAMVTVFIDGFFDEPASVARMFGLRVNQHEGVSKGNSRICQVCISYCYKGKIIAMNSQVPVAQDWQCLTALNSCHSVFTNQSIFRLNFPRISHSSGSPDDK